MKTLKRKEIYANGDRRKERGTATRITEHCLSAMRGGLVAIV